MTKNLKSYLPGILKLARAIQQIPSPTFSESEKGEYISKIFQKEGLNAIQTDPVGNVYACIPGKFGQPLVITAHMDTVHPLGTPLGTRQEGNRIYGPAIGDNSLGVACLAGLARWALDQNTPLPGDLWLIANVCEEGLGDLRGMQAVVDHFGTRPVAYLIVEGMGLGHIYHRGLGVERYRVSAHTSGGHSWVDYGKPSAIHIIAEVITRLANLPLPKTPRTSLNVGVIQGGTSVNTIASQASFELDLRSEDGITLRSLSHQVRRMVESLTQPDIRINIEPIGLRAAGEIPAQHPLVKLAAACLMEVGVEPRLEIASTDANAPLGRGIPAVCLGMTTGAGAHTTDEYIDIAPLALGFHQLTRMVEQIWPNLGKLNAADQVT